MKRALVFVMMAILLSGCVVYDKYHTRVTPDGVDFPDGPFIPWVTAHATLHNDTSVQVALVWLYTCGPAGGAPANSQTACFLIYMHNYLSAPPADPLALVAFADCGQDGRCGRTITSAISNMISTQPGASNWTSRCIGWRVEEPIPGIAWFEESQVRVIQDTDGDDWNWFRHGSWGCSNV